MGEYQVDMGVYLQYFNKALSKDESIVAIRSLGDIDKFNPQKIKSLHTFCPRFTITPQAPIEKNYATISCTFVLGYTYT